MKKRERVTIGAMSVESLGMSTMLAGLTRASELCETFYAADIARADPRLPLTSYFDPVSYQIGKPNKKKAAAQAPAPRGPTPDNVRSFIAKQKAS